MDAFNTETMQIKLQEIATKGQSIEMRDKLRFLNCITEITVSVRLPRTFSKKTAHSITHLRMITLAASI